MFSYANHAIIKMFEAEGVPHPFGRARVVAADRTEQPSKETVNLQNSPLLPALGTVKRNWRSK